MKKFFLALGLILGFSIPAKAEFQPTEKKEIRSIIFACESLQEGLAYLGDTLVLEVTAANKSLLSGVWADQLQAIRECDAAWALYLGMAPDQTDWKSKTRAEWVAAANVKLDRTLLYINTVETKITSAQNATVGAVAKDNLRRMRDIWNANAKSRVTNFNRTLSYCCVDTADAPFVIKPHGTFYSAANTLQLAIGFAHDWVSFGRDIFSQEVGVPARPVVDYSWTSRLLRVRARVTIRNYRVWGGRMARLPMQNSPDCENWINPFHLIAFGTLPMMKNTSGSSPIVVAGLNSPGFVVDGAPYHFNQYLHDTQAFFIAEARFQPELAAAINNHLTRLSEAWRFGDGSVFQTLVFPNADPAVLDGVGDSGPPTPFGAPLCPVS